MAIFLTVLKWIGIILLIILALVLVILLLVLLVPFNYKAAATVDDPETHSEFPVAVLKERSKVNAEVSWLLGAVKVLVAYPGSELLAVKIFGKDIGLMDKLAKGGEEEEEETQEQESEEEETSLEEKVQKISDKVTKLADAADYAYRVLTGRCARRAWSKVSVSLKNILLHILPSYYAMNGTVGLADPCLNGKFTGVCSMLMPFVDDHIQMETEWDQYRCDLSAELSGRLRLGVPVKEAIPLVLNKDCRKVLSKLKKVRAKLQSEPQENKNDPAVKAG